MWPPLHQRESSAADDSAEIYFGWRRRNGSKCRFLFSGHTQLWIHNLWLLWLCGSQMKSTGACQFLFYFATTMGILDVQKIVNVKFLLLVISFFSYLMKDLKNWVGLTLVTNQTFNPSLISTQLLACCQSLWPESRRRVQDKGCSGPELLHPTTTYCPSASLSLDLT